MPPRISAAAARDLEDILVYGITTFGEAQALKYRVSLSRVFEMLGDMPNIGRRSESGVPDERRFPHGRHVVYYLTSDQGVVITRVIGAPMITDPWGDSG